MPSLEDLDKQLEQLQTQVSEYRQDILVLENNLTNTQKELAQTKKELEETKQELHVANQKQDTLQNEIYKPNPDVKRDFIAWNTKKEVKDPIHIKTNIPKKSNVMYRILVEGYNQGKLI